MAAPPPSGDGIKVAAASDASLTTVGADQHRSFLRTADAVDEQIRPFEQASINVAVAPDEQPDGGAM